jgi:membrane-associated protein
VLRLSAYYSSAVLSTILASILSPETFAKGGLLLVAAVIFAESGLLIGFFLPGDSLLFITGFLLTKPTGLSAALTDVKFPPLPVVLLILFLAAVAGDQVGYLFGSKVGPALFKREDSKLFKQSNVLKAQAFFDKHGPKAIVMARFVPVVRTFAPVLAGVSKMKYRTFVTFNLIGGAMWAVGITLLGYFLGKVTFIREHIDLAVVGIICLSLLPVALEFVKHRRTAVKV